MNTPVMESQETMAGDSLRLNLGGRDTSIPGFKTVDLKPGPTVAFVTDISDLSMFKDGEVSEIYGSHCLEHFPHTKTLSVLQEWRRVLKKNGKCFIAVPDFDAAVKAYMQNGIMTDWIRNFLWGDQGYDLAYHYTGFTFPILANLLSKAGFSEIIRIKDMPYNVKDCSKLVSTYTREFVSLMVEATA